MQGAKSRFCCENKIITIYFVKIVHNNVKGDNDFSLFKKAFV